MSINKMNRLLWFISYMTRQPYPVSKRTIDEAWVNNGFGENLIPIEDGEMLRKVMPRSTFNRFIASAREIFGINIIHTKQGWTIEETTKSKAARHLLESIGVFGSIQRNPELNKRIMIEDIPSSHNNLEIIMQAISDRNAVSFCYWRYDEDMDPRSTEFVISEIKPFGLRLYGSRWYVIGDWGDDNMWDNYESAWYRIEDYNDWSMMNRFNKIKYIILPLDRMYSVKIEPIKFKIPEDFDQEKFFEDFVGPYADMDIPKQKIVVEAKGPTAFYIESLPIHHSQKNIKEYEEDTDIVIHFEYDLRPTHYFYRELLKYGSGVKVLSPESARLEMKRFAQGILDNYPDIQLEKNDKLRTEKGGTVERDCFLPIHLPPEISKLFD